MNTSGSGIVAASLASLDVSQRQEALQGWDWLASLAERSTGSPPCSDSERAAHWLGRLQEEGLGAFGLHAEVGLAFFASIGHEQAMSGILNAAMDDTNPASVGWVGAGPEQLANDALCLAARGCTDDRAVALLLQIQQHDLPLNLPGDAGITPLHAACAAGKPSLVRALLACGADPRQIDRRGMTALHHLALVPVWQASLANVEARSDIANDLLDAGGRLDQEDGLGRTARLMLERAGWPSELLGRVEQQRAHQPITLTAPSSYRH